MLAQAARSPRASAMLPTRMNLLRPRDRYLLVEGLRLHVLDWGGDGRTPLLLLHGFTGHAHAWDTLSIALQPHVHVYALDARGHGDSDPADTYTAAAAFDDISGVVDQLGLTSCVLVGLSMGGRNAMYFASQRPERVQKLVVVDIGPEVSARATAPVSGPPEPDTWESIEQAARHLYRANRIPASTITVGSSRTVSGRAPMAPWCGRGIRASRRAAPSRTSTGGPSCAPSRRPPSSCVVREATCSTVTSQSGWRRNSRTADSSRSRGPSTRSTRTTPRRCWRRW